MGHAIGRIALLGMMFLALPVAATHAEQTCELSIVITDTSSKCSGHAQLRAASIPPGALVQSPDGQWIPGNKPLAEWVWLKEMLPLDSGILCGSNGFSSYDQFYAFAKQLTAQGLPFAMSANGPVAGKCTVQLNVPATESHN